jgi:hypothetical protein
VTPQSKHPSLAGALLLAALCLGAHCSEQDPVISADYSNQVLLKVTTELPDAPAIAVRQVRPNYETQCWSMWDAELPTKQIGQFFGPPITIKASAGRPVSRRLTSQACGILLVEHPNFEPRIFHFNTSPFELDEIGLRVTADGVRGPSDAFDMFNAGAPNNDPHLAWSKPPALGVALRVEALSETAGHCFQLKLAAALSAANDRPKWDLCTGTTALPFTVGDIITIDCPSPNNSCRDALRITATVASKTGMSKTGAGRGLTLWLAKMSAERFSQWENKPPVVDKIEVNLRDRRAPCYAVDSSECRALRCDGQATLTAAGRTVKLHIGEGITLRAQSGNRVEVQVVHASLWPITAKACEQPNRWLELAAVERKNPAPVLGLAQRAR